MLLFYYNITSHTDAVLYHHTQTHKVERHHSNGIVETVGTRTLMPFFLVIYVAMKKKTWKTWYLFCFLLSRTRKIPKVWSTGTVRVNRFAWIERTFFVYFYLSMHFPAVTSSFLVFFLLFNKRLYDTLQEIWNFQPFLVNFFESIERRRGNPSELSCQPSFKLCSMRPGFLSLSLSLSL